VVLFIAIPEPLPLHPVHLQKNGIIVPPAKEAGNANIAMVQVNMNTQKTANAIHVPEPEMESAPDAMVKADGISKTKKS